MNTRDFLEKIKKARKAIFTANDLVKITNKRKEYLKVYLFRLKKKELIQEVERGKYIISQHPFITASNLIFPSYISFLSAYSYYQITTQIPRIIQVVTLCSKKSLELENYTIKFIKLPARKLFGYHKESFMEKEIFIAEKEKAIIDSLYLPKYCPLDETKAALEVKLDINKLISYALKMNSKVLLKRLGYLLELKNIDIHKRVQKYLNKRYDPLNPFQKKLKKKPGKSEKWRLIINEVF